MSDLPDRFKGLPETGMWASFKLDCRFYWDTLKFVAIEHDWRSVMKPLLWLDKGLKEAAGGGLVCAVLTFLYFYFTPSLVGGFGWSLAIFLGMVSVFLWSGIHAARIRSEVEIRRRDESEERNEILERLHLTEMNVASVGHLATVAHSAVTSMATRIDATQLETSRTDIRITIKDICDQMYTPLHEGFRFDHRIFVRLYLVNTGAETNIQQFAARLWVDDVEYTGKQMEARGHRLLTEEPYRDPKELNPSFMTAVRDLIDLEDTKADPLKPRIGREGWVSFLFHNVEIEIVEGYKLKESVKRLEITIIDGSGESRTEESTGPWECPGKIVETPPEWIPLSSPFDTFR